MNNQVALEWAVMEDIFDVCVNNINGGGDADLVYEAAYGFDSIISKVIAFLRNLIMKFISWIAKLFGSKTKAEFDASVDNRLKTAGARHAAAIEKDMRLIIKGVPIVDTQITTYSNREITQIQYVDKFDTLVEKCTNAIQGRYESFEREYHEGNTKALWIEYCMKKLDTILINDLKGKCQETLRKMEEVSRNQAAGMDKMYNDTGNATAAEFSKILRDHAEYCNRISKGIAKYVETLMKYGATTS